MSTPNRPVGGQNLAYPRADRAEDHPELMAWWAEQEAERAPIDQCEGNCYDAATGEFTEHYPCPHCRARDLTGIDLDGHDDKRETPGEA